MSVEAVPLRMEPDPYVIELAERLLRDAKAGDLQGVAIAGINQRGEVATWQTGWMDVFRVVGALETLKIVLLNSRAAHVRMEIQGAAENPL